jgi:dienelactone hydrolase
MQPFAAPIRRRECRLPALGVTDMRLHLFMAMTALAVWAPSANGQTVTVQSGSYVDFRQLLSRETPTDTASIDMTLRLPDQAQDRYPAVVVVHSLGGYLESNEGWHAAEFRKAGFATLTYDSPAARSMRRGPAIGSSGGPPWASAVAEAYSALRLLAGDPRIDASRIAIVGFSFGGEVAHLAAFERLRAALVPGQNRFAAHVSYYPAGVYGAAAEPVAYTGAPILMLLGEKDDNLPVAKAEEYLTYTRSAGVAPPIDVSIYPGAYHAWTVSSLGAPRFYPQYPSTRKCPYLLLGPSQPALLISGQEAPMDPNAFRTCLKDGQGYTMAYDESARAKSTRETVDFLVKSLRP